MARVNWWGFLTETAGLTLRLEQAQDVVNLDCRWVSGVVCGDGGMLVGLRVSKISNIQNSAFHDLLVRRLNVTSVSFVFLW